MTENLHMAEGQGGGPDNQNDPPQEHLEGDVSASEGVQPEGGGQSMLEKRQDMASKMGISTGGETLEATGSYGQRPVETTYRPITGEEEGQTMVPASELPTTGEEAKPADQRVIYDIESEELTPEVREKIDKANSVLTDRTKSAGEIVDALKELRAHGQKYSYDEMRTALSDAGHSTQTLQEVMDQQSQWAVSEEELAQDPDEQELTEEQKQEKEAARGEMSEVIQEMKKVMDVGSLDRLTEEEFLNAQKVQEKARGAIGRWLDKNPGNLHKANRLLVRPGIAAMLIIAVLYLSLLNAMTKNAAKKFG